MPRMAPWIAVTLLSLGLIAGGCGGKQQSSGSAGKSKTKQSQSKSKGQSAKKSKSNKKAAGMTSGQTKKAAVPSTSGTTTPSGNASGSNMQAVQLYQQKCQVCHGASGVGGSAPKLDSGLKTRFQTQAQVATFIRTNMPFNNPGSLSDAQASALARYLWSLQKG